MKTLDITDSYIHSRCGVYRCHYHIVFATKYRRKVLTAEVESALKAIFSTIASDNDFSIDACEVGTLDHVHLFVSAKPKTAPASILKQLKGISARRLHILMPVVRCKVSADHFWSPSYFLSTVGHVTEETVRKYIEAQTK